MATVQKSDSEKWDFVGAVYKYGANNIDNLAAVLPTWSKTEIEAFIKRFRCRAKRTLETEEGPEKTAALNEWSKIIENLHQLQGSTNAPWWRKGRAKMDEEPKDHTPSLCKSLMYASCFEDHFKGSSSDDPDYGEIYCYLSQLVAGNEPTQLKPGSAAKVLEMLSKIKKVVMDESSMKDVAYLANLQLSSVLSAAADGEKSSTSNNEDNRCEMEFPDEKCPLFNEEVADGDLKPLLLDPCDPYSEHKKELFYKKLKKSQEMEASNLTKVPGMNPVELQPKRLVKPSLAVVDLQNL